MKLLHKIYLTAFLILMSTNVLAQGPEVTREIQLGSLFTAGNTDSESLNFAFAMTVNPESAWEYNFSIDGLYASSDSEVKGQRLYGVASADYTFSENSFFQTRASHEDDRFSGYDSQSDLTVSYGRGFLQNRPDMALTVNTGLGVRWSRLDGSDFDEPIFRLAGDYDWTISETATFNQQLSSEAGTDSNIYRSVSSIETEILDNISLRFSLKIKHQTEVPAGRKETDTETAVTFVWNF